MDKRKLAFYTRFCLLSFQKLGQVSAKELTDIFMQAYPDFFKKKFELKDMDAKHLSVVLFRPKDEPDPVKESFDELFEARDNQSQTGTFEITFKITK